MLAQKVSDRSFGSLVLGGKGGSRAVAIFGAQVYFAQCGLSGIVKLGERFNEKLSVVVTHGSGS